MPLINGRGCTANAALRISSAFVGAWVCLITESRPICGNLRAAGRGLLEAEHAGCLTGLRGVSFDGDFHAVAFALEKGFAGIFHNGNVRRRVLHRKFDRIGFAFAIAVAIIQPFAAVGEVAGSLHIGKMPDFNFVIVHGYRMYAKSRRVSHCRHFMYQARFGQSVGCRLLLDIAVSRFHFV